MLNYFLFLYFFEFLVFGFDFFVGLPAVVLCMAMPLVLCLKCIVLTAWKWKP